MFADDKVYDVALSFLHGVGDINAKKLINYFGTSKSFFSASLNDLKAVPGLSHVGASKIISSFDTAVKLAEDELQYVYANDINLVTFIDDEYPSKLRECDDAPIIMYYKGNPDFSSNHVVSIVGTRKATKYGTEFCDRFVADMAEKYPDAVVVSGLAYGIDVASHKAALENNLQTWAILGHSLETVYPSDHRKVADKILANGGALVSDFHHGSRIDPSNFVKRNRIVAGLCDALLVVESGEKGGSIITANIANAYNKDVFALPGNITSQYSKGCNHLIKTNRANLCESFADFEYIMNWSSKGRVVMPKLEFKFDLTPDEQKVVDVLSKYEFLDIDNLHRQTELNPNELSLIILQLELKNVIVALPGKIFSLKRI
ncbi:MAG: DNA-protecting protein DprA [Bacteroidales bacterium]|nr:DNA-protecting protein DprA [Bacteroidales bacterium]